MANPEHIEIIKQGEEAKTAYLESLPKDFDFANFKWDIRFADLSGITINDLTFSDDFLLEGTNFTNVTFKNCEFNNGFPFFDEQKDVKITNV